MKLFQLFTAEVSLAFKSLKSLLRQNLVLLQLSLFVMIELLRGLAGIKNWNTFFSFFHTDWLFNSQIFDCLMFTFGHDKRFTLHREYLWNKKSLQLFLLTAYTAMEFGIHFAQRQDFSKYVTSKYSINYTIFFLHMCPTN